MLYYNLFHIKIYIRYSLWSLIHVIQIIYTTDSITISIHHDIKINALECFVMLYSVPQSVLAEYGIFMNYFRYPKVTVFNLEVPSPEYVVAKEDYLHLSWSSAAVWSVVLVQLHWHVAREVEPLLHAWQHLSSIGQVSPPCCHPLHPHWHYSRHNDHGRDCATWDMPWWLRQLSLVSPRECVRGSGIEIPIFQIGFRQPSGTWQPVVEDELLSLKVSHRERL